MCDLHADYRFFGRVEHNHVMTKFPNVGLQANTVKNARICRFFDAVPAKYCPDEYTSIRFTGSNFTSCFRVQCLALFNSGYTFMRQSFAPLPTFTHFPHEDGLGTFILDII